MASADLGEGNVIMPRGMKFLKTLGAGGFGVVFLVSRKGGEKVALKVTRSKRGWKREVDAYQRVRDFCGQDTTGVVCMVAKGQTKDAAGAVLYYLAMDYVANAVEGGDFFVNESAVAKLVAASYSQLRACFLDAAQKLSRVQRHGLAFRDIKPENLMFALDSGTCVFIDLGLLCVAEKTPISAEGGTSYFHSPELHAVDANGAEQVQSGGFRQAFWLGNDCWALCVAFIDLLILKELHTHHRPIPEAPFYNHFKAVGDVFDAMEVYGAATNGGSVRAAAGLLRNALGALRRGAKNDPDALDLIDRLESVMLVDGKEPTSPLREVLARMNLRIAALQTIAALETRQEKSTQNASSCPSGGRPPTKKKSPAPKAPRAKRALLQASPLRASSPRKRRSPDRYAPETPTLAKKQKRVR